MNNPLLLHQMVETMHAERIASSRSGPRVIARVVANLDQVIWRYMSLHADAHDRDVPAWLGLLPQSVDEPAVRMASSGSGRLVGEPAREECTSA
ncbi:MAG TPA: hypothetical protein VG266_04260 [Candidatus Dormibacteraeota bacterium]|jgi:hypothetical protein|nr:hypothetical protein [Candidatus Dormibacteraeota bacterium]